MPQLRAHTAYKVLVTPSTTFENLIFNVLDTTYSGRPNPLHVVRVRRALALAIDRAGLMEKVFGVSHSVAQSLVAYTPLVGMPRFIQPYADSKILKY